jgi:hypothetical protein
MERALAAVTVLALGGLALAACSGSTTTPVQMSCPRIMQAPGADTIALFGPGGSAAKDVMVAGKIASVDVSCQREKVGLAVNAEIDLYAERVGPNIKDATFPYFVALIDPQQKVLVEDAFKVPFPFLPGESYRYLLPEKVTVHLPVKNQGSGSAYTVVVGFQLTPDQIAFNRAARTQ